jgi:antirestriction protein ArdC
MAHARTHRSARPRANLYAQITNRITAELEAGRLPWVQPWESAKASIGMPYNAISNRRYSGINILTLWDAIISRDLTSHAFLAFRQAIALGGNVRRGEQGIGVIYTRRLVPREEQRRADTEAASPRAAFPFSSGSPSSRSSNARDCPRISANRHHPSRKG